MNSEDFFAFAYPALIILGVLSSLIPAYIASKRNRNFWLWWIATAAIFTALLLVLIKYQAVSLSIYLLAIVPIAATLALLPKVRLSLPRLRIFPKSEKARNILSFLLIPALVLAFGVMLDLYLLATRKNYVYPVEEGSYGAYLAILILLACVGFTSFLFFVARRRVGQIAAAVFLLCLFALPVLLKPTQAYAVLPITRRLTGTDILLRQVITDLIRLPIAGVFVLAGLSAGCAIAAFLFEDRFRVISRTLAAVLSIMKKIAINPPSLHLSKNPAVSFWTLMTVLFMGLFLKGCTFGEGAIFILPFLYICVTPPMTFVYLGGIVLSSIVIMKCIQQKKTSYALAVFLCGLLLGLTSLSADSSLTDLLTLTLPTGLMGFIILYGIGSGLAALILWVVSDVLRPGEIDSTQS